MSHAIFQMGHPLAAGRRGAMPNNLVLVFGLLLLPRYELYETGSQLRRSSKSISANIVEGYCRRRDKAEFIRYLVFSHASCNETIEWMEYVRDCHFDFWERTEVFLPRFDQLGGKINRFIASVERDHRF